MDGSNKSIENRLTKEVEIISKPRVEQDALVERAKILSHSDLIPPAFQKKPANVLVALELAQETGFSALMVMQNIYIIHGKASLSSAFLLSLLYKSNLFQDIIFEFNDDKNACRVKAKTKKGVEVFGTWITLEMAKAEGWSTKPGSKWKTLPELMLQYRAAAFFCRIHAPHLLMGFQTEDEVRDVGGVVEPQKKKKTVRDLISGANNEND